MSENIFSSLGAERKAMEEARLARLAAKRSAPVEEADPRPTKVAKVAPPVTISKERKGAKAEVKAPINPTASATSSGRQTSKLEYPDGVVKKTWAYGHERSNDIKIEEVLQKRDLTTAIISSFCWDFDWLVTKFDTKLTKFIFVVQARNPAERERLERDFEGLSNIRLCFSPMSDYLRVVLPTANFIAFDWGETGEMENMVYLIDLPRLPAAEAGTFNKTLNSFSAELTRFVDAMGLPKDAKTGLLQFDFSKTGDVRFIHTIGGSFVGDDAAKTGFPHLTKSIRSLGMQTSFSDPLEVDMCASSIGALDRDQLEQFHRSLRGQLPIETPKHPTSKSTKSSSKQTKLNITSNTSTEPVSLAPPSSFHIVFPSVTTIKASKAGPARAGTLFFQPEYYKRDNFPKESVHEYVSRRSRLLSHSKLILARSPSNAFIYLGSHNLSQSAWGRRTFDKKAKQWKLTGVNWECGVLLPAHRGATRSTARGNGKVEETKVEERNEADISTASEDSETESEPEVDAPASVSIQKNGSKQVLGMDVFKSVVDVPFEWPPKRYGPSDVPWCAGSKVD